MIGVVIVIVALVVDVILYLRERRKRIEAEILLGMVLAEACSKGETIDFARIQDLYRDITKPLNKLRNI